MDLRLDNLQLRELPGQEADQSGTDHRLGGIVPCVHQIEPQGLSLDDCESYHRAIQPQLEQYDYDFLEVSSPGVDRPLKTPRDYERHLGDEVEVKLFKAVNGQKVYTGILAGLDEEKQILLDTPAGRLTFAQKAAATVRPVVDMSGIENVDLSE